ncbi:Phosphotransferase enzyme family protein [Bhargavaea cecembensis DSE10]|uniref:Phosphotransferase enzyme family protein n=1 Tax=Bhargavaea cecembensis DSE10 TaxID=1235279 RepID=M7NF34_9BACL|nr:aminoglycoside phosphotransferase family protein [Bhargavaea cecembensis]EMR07173.1 Phosphotransferase enzyme family protein [Bhargavaea cecembensis DSE10]
MASAARPIRDYLPGLLVLAGGLYTVYYYYMYWIRVYGALCLPGYGDPVKVEVTQGIWIRLDAILFPTVFGVILALLGVMLVWKKKFGAAVVALVLSATVINWPAFIMIAGGALLGLLFWRKTLLPTIDLPDETMEWVDAEAGLSVLKSFRRLPSERLAYSFHNEGGGRFVVKETSSAESAERETRVLNAAAENGLPAPEAKATDGRFLLMPQLDGFPFLQPLDFEAWTDEIAGILTTTHSAPKPDMKARRRPAEPVIPDRAFDRANWERAARIFREETADAVPVFVHGDFEPANVLFSGGRATGLTGWDHAGSGPAQLDVGRMRVALELIHGGNVADRFLAKYKNLSKDRSFRYSRYWDLLAVYGWLEQDPGSIASHWRRFGITTLSEDEVMRRLERFVKTLTDKE